MPRRLGGVAALERHERDRVGVLVVRRVHAAFDVRPLGGIEIGKVDVAGHIGVHAQSQPGLHYIGVSVPVGRLPVQQMRALADIADQFGSGELRLTVWQNLLISGVRCEHVAEAVAAIEALGLSTRASAIRAGLVACTGNVGCKFAASDTKRHAEDIARWCETRVGLDGPINIHLTGCPNSCAQHYMGDIGLLGAKVKQSGDTVEGYHVVLGGGFGNKQAVAREIFKGVPFNELTGLLEHVLKTYLSKRQSGESFVEFTGRHSVKELQEMFSE